MYKKSGSKLKTIALLIRVFGFIVALASAIACWSIAGNISSYNETLKSVMIGAGFEIGIIIIVPVLIGSLILEGFGDLIVLTDDNNECLRKWQVFLLNRWLMCLTIITITMRLIPQVQLTITMRLIPQVQQVWQMPRIHQAPGFAQNAVRLIIQEEISA